jgi:hypothetical protein
MPDFMESPTFASFFINIIAIVFLFIFVDAINYAFKKSGDNKARELYFLFIGLFFTVILIAFCAAFVVQFMKVLIKGLS